MVLAQLPMLTSKDVKISGHVEWPRKSSLDSGDGNPPHFLRGESAGLATRWMSRVNVFKRFGFQRIQRVWQSLSHPSKWSRGGGGAVFSNRIFVFGSRQQHLFFSSLSIYIWIQWYMITDTYVFSILPRSVPFLVGHGDADLVLFWSADARSRTVSWLGAAEMIENRGFTWFHSLIINH